MVPRLEEFKELLIAEGVGWWRLFTIFPVGRARNDESLRLTDGQFREVLEFIRRTRREGRIDVSYACEGFLGRYEGEVRDDFYQCAAGVSVASIRVDGAISGCTSIRSNFHQGNIYRDDFWEVWQNPSSLSATALGPARVRAPPAICSVIARAEGCTCTTTTVHCSTAIIIGSDVLLIFIPGSLFRDRARIDRPGASE